MGSKEPPLIATEESEEITSREVIETTNNKQQTRDLSENIVKMQSNEGTATPIKGVLFGIGVAAILSICCIICCVLWSKRKRKKQGMAAQYHSASGLDSDDELDEVGMVGASKGNQGDVEEEDIEIAGGAISNDFRSKILDK